MFDFFKKKPPPAAARTAALRSVPSGPAVPPPLAGRNGHVGAIEAIAIDGTMYFFGFDFRSDLVLSPLIESPALMARFASRHMVQRDGTHNEAYWRELVGMAKQTSELCNDDDGRRFNSRMLAATLARLAVVRGTGTPDPGFRIEHHLRYLLGAAGGWRMPNPASPEDVDLWIAQIAGKEPQPEDATLQDVAARLQQHLNALLTAAPGNWAAHFAVLRS